MEEKLDIEKFKKEIRKFHLEPVGPKRIELISVGYDEIEIGIQDNYEIFASVKLDKKELIELIKQLVVLL